MMKVIHPGHDTAGEQLPGRRCNLNRVDRRLTNTLFMGSSSIFFLTGATVRAANNRYIDVTVLS